MAIRVAVILLERYTDSGPCVLLDVLRTANALLGEPRFVVELKSAAGGPVRSASGGFSATTKPTSALRTPDVVVVPGVWTATPAAVDAALARPETAPIVRTLRRSAARGALVTGVCAGVFWLAEAGVLDGRRATTTWWLAEHLQRRWPAIDVEPKASLVLAGRIATAGAVFAVADLALHLVTRFAGAEIAHRCANLLLLDPHPSQAPYMAMHQLGANDETVRAAERWARAHLAEAFDVATLAKAVGTSPRTLARRLDAAAGMTPIELVRRLRLESAVHLLRTTRLSVDEISTKVGYGDVGTLRRLCHEHLHTSPRDIRRRAPASGASPRGVDPASTRNGGPDRSATGRARAS